MAVPKRAPFGRSNQTYFVTTKCFAGQQLLQSERCALLLIDTLYRYREQGKFALHAFVVMPDHMHASLSPMEATLERAMQLIKGGYSYRLSREPGHAKRSMATGIFRSSHQGPFRLPNSPHVSRKQSGKTRALPGSRVVPVFLRQRQIRTRLCTSVAKAMNS